MALATINRTFLSWLFAIVGADGTVEYLERFHVRADTDECPEAYRRACGAAVFGDDLDESERDLAVASVAATVTLPRISPLTRTFPSTGAA